MKYYNLLQINHNNLQKMADTIRFQKRTQLQQVVDSDSKTLSELILNKVEVTIQKNEERVENFKRSRNLK